jgi:hypothetical protein
MLSLVPALGAYVAQSMPDVALHRSLQGVVGGGPGKEVTSPRRVGLFEPCL